MHVIFLDANVLFSAACGSTRPVDLWELENVRLVTSRRAMEEAHRNLPTPEQRERLQALLRAVVVSPMPSAAAEELLRWSELAEAPAAGSGASHVSIGSDLQSRLFLPDDVHLPQDDSLILLDALRSGATHFLTGDVRHFGPLFGRRVGQMLILRPAHYLRQRRE